MSEASTRRLIIEFVTDVSKLKKGFSEAEGFTDKFKAGAVGVAKVAGTVLTVATAADVMKDSLQAAVENETSVSALATQMDALKIPKENQKSVEDFIHKLSLTKGVADNELRPAFAQLLRSTGDTTTAMQELGLAQDIAAGKGISVASAADILAMATIGNLKPLRTLGVNLDDASKYGAGTEGIFKKLAVVFHGAGDAAAETAKGKLAKMSVGFEDMKVKIGTLLMPAMEKLVDFITNTLLPGFEAFTKWLGDHKEVLIAFGIVVGVVLVSAFAAWAIAAATAAVTTVIAMAPVIAIAAAVAAAVYLIVDNWDTIVDFFQKLPGRILDFLKNLPDLLVDLGKKLLSGFLDGIVWLATTGLKAYFLDIPLMILGWMLDASLWLLDVGKKVLGGFLDGIVWVAENVLYQYFIGIPLKILEWVGKADLWLFDKGKDVLLGIVHGLESAWSDLFTWFFNLPGRLWQLVVDGAEWLVDFGRNLVKGIVKGIKEAPGAIRDALISLVPGGGGTVDKILKYIGIPAFAEGGYVGGPVGAPQLAVVHGGEYVVSNAMQAAGGAGSVVVNNYITLNAGLGTDPRQLEDAFVSGVTNWFSRNGRLPWMAA